MKKEMDQFKIEMPKPNDWKQEILKDVINKVSTNNKKIKESDYKKNGVYPVIDQGQNFISGYFDNKKNLVEICKPVVVFGDHTKVVKFVNFSFVPGADGVKVLSPKDELSEKFFYYLVSYLSSVLPSKGYARHFQYIEKSLIAYPDKKIQKLIIEKIDSIFSDIDAGVEELKNTKEKLEFYKQSVLNAAIRGKLVPQDPKDEPACKLLERIRAEKEKLIKEGKIKKEKPLPPIDPSEIPFELPKGWEWVRLRDICYLITDGEHATPKRENTGRLLLSARNVTNEGLKLANVDYVSQSEFDKIRKRCSPEKGDIFLSCSGSVGRVCLVDKNNEYSLVRSVALLKPVDKYIDEMYLVYCLRSAILQLQIKRASKATAQANIFLGPISSLLIPLPTSLTVKRIVQSVDDKMNELNKLLSIVNLEISSNKTLKQSILKQAFEGKLL